MKYSLNVKNKDMGYKVFEKYFAPIPKGNCKIVENEAERIKYNQEMQKVTEDARYRFAKSRQSASKFFFNA